MDIATIVHLVGYLIVCGIILGLLLYLVSKLEGITHPPNIACPVAVHFVVRQLARGNLTADLGDLSLYLGLEPVVELAERH